MHPAVSVDLCRAEEAAAVAQLYRDAFPEEDLYPLVRQLSEGDCEVLALAARDEAGLAGHIMFTLCAVPGQPEPAALLAPLAVAPRAQRSGIGSALIAEGLTRLKDRGVAQVFVLGDPGYYGRFGFLPETHVAPPYALPPDWDGAWQSLWLSEPCTAAGGTLRVPAPWKHKVLWAP